jgi:hypothetical protein
VDRVLVVIVYTDFKYYCRPLVPRIFDDLTYSNKELLFVSEKNFPGLSNYSSGEMIAAMGRDFGIRYAREKGFDWVFQSDVDTIQPDDVLERLLEVSYPLVGGAHACRGDSTNIIGHIYTDEQNLIRAPLKHLSGFGVAQVGGVSGGCLLIHKSIFGKVDYSGYQGPNTIPMRFTGDDEFFQIKVLRQLGIRPKINLAVRPWHLSTDGFAYRWFGDKKKFTRNRDIIIFNGRKYVQKEI